MKSDQAFLRKMFAPILLLCRAALAAGLLVLLVSCSPYTNDSTLGRILEDGALKVGSIYGRTTYYYGATSAEGFEYELAKGFADYLGVKLEVYPYYDFRQVVAQLDANRLDLVAANITMTEQRKKKYKFGPAYQNLNFELVYRKGKNRPRDIEQLEGDLTIIANDLYREPLVEAVGDRKQISWNETSDKDIEELLEMVSNDELDYTISDSNILAVARRRFPNLGIGFSVTDTLQIAWLLNKQTDDSLRAALLEYFGSMQRSGQLAVLEDKYFGHVRKFDFVDTRAFMRAVTNTLPKYRDMFEAHAGDLDWRLIAAMAYQESHWDPKAKSPTGVRGMMMLTRGTAKDMGVTKRTDAEQSISGGARYFSSLLRRIPARIQEPDKIWIAMAAYNVGLGHLEDARRITEAQGYNPDLWIDVKKHLPLLRQKRFYQNTRYGYARGDEAVNYVENIRRYYDSLVWLEQQESLPDLMQEEQPPSPVEDEASPLEEDLDAPAEQDEQPMPQN
ncbi:membrane-bound lytic murein transglycosylase MltF [Glaciecola siphonariae]|uniref:Membrane-bound lytic murein transglycosylase F n=1 Tax=Glaciecola siphonariae TaxID=521012 RepID=A0ABV9LVZ1_9ALTE